MTAHSRAAPNLPACVREAPHNVGHQRGAEHVLRRCTHVPILSRTDTRRFPSASRLRSSSGCGTQPDRVHRE